MVNILKQIPSVKLPFVDSHTGKISPEWFRFLDNLSIGGFLIAGNNLSDVASTSAALANLGGIALPGNTDITTLGTITTGTWHGSLITGTYGGTGVNNGSSTITLANNLSTSGNFALTLTTTNTTNATFPPGTTTLAPTSTDISSSGIVTKTNNVAFAASATTDTTNASNISSGTLPAARLPNPSSSTLGGVQSLASSSHNWINQISTSGVPSATQPAFTDISGTATIAQGGTGVTAWPAMAVTTSNTSIAANGFTKVTFSTETYDIGSYMTTTTYTPLVAGIYAFSAIITFNATTASTRYGVAIYKNGSAIRWVYGTPAGTNGQSFHIAGQCIMNGSTDTLEVYGWNNHATIAQALDNGATSNNFEAKWVGPSS